MKNLLFFLSLIAVTWVSVLLWDSPPEFFFKSKKTKLESLPSADSYMHNTSTIKFDEDGNRGYLLTATTGLYYSRDNRFELQSPNLIARKSPTGLEPWQMTAEAARSTSGGELILLIGNVYAWQTTATGLNELFTSDISYTPENNTAETASPVKLSSPQGITTGTGMEANFSTEIYRLLANVESKYHGQ
ncbi:MAG: LPS export ABC transporter periplasmic protein LptC [Porticoccaceae bacterium]|nr:LPS export ABC transporter periplasmic protein LptC [Porticoccaceae bacterium]